MGIAAFLVWSSYAPADASAFVKTSADKEAVAGKKASADKKKGIKIAFTLFGIQLVLNTLWSIIFFGLHSPGGALVEIMFLWLAILATIITFYKISPPAGGRLLPYILWVSFAMYLNYGIWMLN